jgi:exodeoxyribonuclease VII large subunit
LAAITRNLLLQRRARLDRLAGRLEVLSPVAILDRGYALVFDASGNLVKNAARLSPEDNIRARLAEGEFTAKVTEVRGRNQTP